MKRVGRMMLAAAALLPVGSASAVVVYVPGTPPTATRNTTAPTGTLANSGWQLQGEWAGAFLGTPISTNQFITAQHVGGSVGGTFSFNAANYTTTGFVDVPNSDLRIWQVGGTLGKDLGRFVLQSEAVYTAGRQFEVARLSAADGVVPQDTLDYIFSLTFTLPKDGRLNLQAFQRIFFQHDPDILYDSVESGVSLLLSARLLPKVEPQIFVVQSLNSNDRMIRLRTTWYAEQNLSVAFGVDTFAGPPLGYFGRFANRDRLYGEVRYSF